MNTTTTTINVFRNTIEFDFNVSSDGWISENFSKSEKYATAQVSELLGNDTLWQIALWKIFETLAKVAETTKLDYIQHLTINWEQVWCIDNGDYITLLTPDEY